MKNKTGWTVPVSALLVMAITATMFLAPVALAESGKGQELVNINTADIQELTSLPGIGSSKAAAIVDYRKEHGPFAQVDELIRIQGIGSNILEKIRTLISVR